MTFGLEFSLFNRFLPKHTFAKNAQDKGTE